MRSKYTDISILHSAFNYLVWHFYSSIESLPSKRHLNPDNHRRLSGLTTTKPLVFQCLFHENHAVAEEIAIFFRNVMVKAARITKRAIEPH